MTIDHERPSRQNETSHAALRKLCEVYADHESRLATYEAARDTLADAVPALLDEIERLLASLVEHQRHRDAWRGYAYGRGPRPRDYISGNMVPEDRGPTAVDENERLRTALDAVHDALGEDRGSDDESVAEGVREWISAAKSADAELERLRARIERLEAALRPFAALYEKYRKAAFGLPGPTLAVPFELLEQAAAALGTTTKETPR